VSASAPKERAPSQASTRKERPTQNRPEAAPNPVWGRLALAGIRPKLQIGAPDDPLEREADRVAERVLRMPDSGDPRSALSPTRSPVLRRKCAACEEEEREGQVRRESDGQSGPAAGEVPPSVRETLSHPGEPLDARVRRRMEPGLGADLFSVRVHRDGQAAESARAIGARAYAYGSHIAFAAGQFAPETGEGRRLLAHELAHVIQAPGFVARDPDPKAADQPKCVTTDAPGAARAEPNDHALGPSGTYYIRGPVYNGEDVGDYCDKTIQAWIPWRFGKDKLSGAVAARIRAEASSKGWHWTNGKVPINGCQSWARMSMEKMNRLVLMAGRDLSTRTQEKKEGEAGLPPLPPPEPIVDFEIVVVASQDPNAPSTSQTRKLDPRVEAEKALDPTSVYEAGTAGANQPPFPARMEGPELEVPSGIGTFTMHLEYERVTADPYMQLAYHMNAVSYTWELFDITQIVKAGMGKEMQEEARRMGLSAQAQSAAGGASRQKAIGDIDQMSEETIRSLQELRDPTRAAEGRSAIDLVTRSIANKLNLDLLPVSAIVAAGGWLVRGFGELLGGYSKEKEIAFPNGQGYYLVRCIAQPHPRGPDGSERRAASVRSQIVEVRPAETLAKNALYMPDAAIAELRARQTMTSDPAEIARLDSAIAKLAEQSGSIERDEKGNVVKETAAGDMVTYLQRLVDEKTKEKADAPSWRQDRIGRELESLTLRLEQAKKNRDGTLGVHHRPRVAFTSFVTGETYPLLIEVAELESKSGTRLRLMDLTVPDRPPIDRGGTDLDQAMGYALAALGESGLGRGSLVARLPPTWPGGARELPPIRTLDGPTAVVKRRLADLATALMVLSIWVPGVGEVSMVLAAGLAVERLVSRAINGTLRLDAESVSDTLAILGAIAQGAQIVGQLRVVKAGGSFVAAIKVGDATALESAAKALEAARKASKILDATSLVTNVGGLLWGDLALLDEFVRLSRDEVDGVITHAEARQRRASMLGNAITNHGIMLGGMLRPRGADKSAGLEKPPLEKVPPEQVGKGAGKETVPESDLAKRSAESLAPRTPGEPVPEPKPGGVRTRFKTPDGLHDIFILNDGTIYRCSLNCAQLRTWYDGYLKSQRSDARRQKAAELDSLLQALETRSANGEKTSELQSAIGTLDVSLRELIAPDLAVELGQGAETRGLVKSGESLLAEDQVRHLLKFFNLDEIKALAGADGLPSADSIRRFAARPDASLAQIGSLSKTLSRPVEQIAKSFEGLAKARTSEPELIEAMTRFGSESERAMLGSLVDRMSAGGESGTHAADFLGRVARISKVEGIKVELGELSKAFENGDAILDHGPLQPGKLLNDIVGSRAMLGEGRLDVGTSGGNMPASLLNPPVLDFVILETDGTFSLVLGFEHTGLSGGRASVYGAGRIRFNKQGIVTEIDNQSGHYRPSSANLDRAVQFMYDRQILSPQRPVKVTHI
jgi:hypothetical protein